MRIVQAVFGVFHHFELARELERRGHLSVIYSTFPWQRLKREGIPRSRVQTFPWLHTGEILLKRYGVHHRCIQDPLSYASVLGFDHWTLGRIPPCDAFIAISGAGLKTGLHVQRTGGRFICDRGSTHQRYQERIISEEYKRWGVTMKVTDIRDILREEKIYEVADAITVPSRFAARSFVEEGLPAEKIHVIPYGVRLDRFVRSGEPRKDRFEVLFVGSVSLRKGVPYLLEAFARVRHSAKRLRIVGPLHPDMRSVLGRLPQENVELLGALPQDRLAEVMSTSHVMVLPSIEEGMALVQGQALSCGCPLISSTNTGAEDLFNDEIEGFIIQVQNTATLTNKMQLLADDPGLQARMSEAALRRVKSLGGWGDYGDRWEALLRELTSDGTAQSYPPPTK